MTPEYSARIDEVLFDTEVQQQVENLALLSHRALTQILENESGSPRAIAARYILWRDK